MGKVIARISTWAALAAEVSRLLGRPLHRDTLRGWVASDRLGIRQVIRPDPISGWPSADPWKLARWARGVQGQRRARK